MTDEVKEKFYNLCDFKCTRYPFPGPMPVPLTRLDLDYMRQKKTYDYNISAKIDGSRYMLYIHENDTFLIDRSMKCYKINMTVKQHVQYGTVLDGELVKDKNEEKWYYVIFDAFAVNGKTIKDVRNHIARIDSVNKCIRDITCIQFTMSVKMFFMFSDLKRALMYNVTLPYETDGLILIPVNRKIFNGTDKRMYKWKKADNHTIDFLLRGGQLYLHDKSELVKICNLSDSDAKKYKDMNDVIVECRLIDEGDVPGWEVVRVRQDKNRANSMMVYLSTIKVITENVQLDDLNL